MEIKLEFKCDGETNWHEWGTYTSESDAMKAVITHFNAIDPNTSLFVDDEIAKQDEFIYRVKKHPEFMFRFLYDGQPMKATDETILPS